MKKFLITLSGVFLGFMLIVSVFFVLNLDFTQEVIGKTSTIEQEAINNKTDIEKKEEIINDVAVLPLKTIMGANDTLANIGESEEDILQDNVIQTPTRQTYYIKVNRLANCVTVYIRDEEGNYTVPVKAMICSVGTDWSTPLGVSKISDKYEWRLLFGDTYGQYTVRFNRHILFHSVPYVKPSNNTMMKGQFNMLGQPASQGCIRLSVADAKWIYDNCPRGTVVEVYDSENPGPLGKPSMLQVNPDSPYSGWDPTDPNPANPWLNSELTIHGVEDRTIRVGETIDLLEGVSATDVDGLTIEVRVSGEVDFNKAGTYKVVYSATSVYGNTIIRHAAITVV